MGEIASSREPTAVAPRGSVADLPPGVHLCNRLESTPKPHSRLLLATILMFVAIMTIFGMMSNRGGVVLFGLPVPPPVAILLPLSILGFWIAIIWRLHRWGRGQDPELSPGPSPDAHINIALHPRQRAALLPLRDEPFEPEIVSLWMPTRSTVLHRNTWAEAFAVIIWSLGIMSFFWLFLLFLSPGPQLQITPIGLILMLLAIAGCAAWCFRRPVQVRIVPGRVDFMHAGTLGFGKLRAESFSLRDGPVRLDLRTSRIEIDRSSKPTQIIELWAPLAQKTSQAAMLTIARAAVSTAEPPELPMDRLTN